MPILLVQAVAERWRFVYDGRKLSFSRRRVSLSHLLLFLGAQSFLRSRQSITLAIWARAFPTGLLPSLLSASLSMPSREILEARSAVENFLCCPFSFRLSNVRRFGGRTKAVFSLASALYLTPCWYIVSLSNFSSFQMRMPQSWSTSTHAVAGTWPWWNSSLHFTAHCSVVKSTPSLKWSPQLVRQKASTRSWLLSRAPATKLSLSSHFSIFILDLLLWRARNPFTYRWSTVPPSSSFLFFFFSFFFFFFGFGVVHWCSSSCSENSTRTSADFVIDEDALRAAITEKTKVIILCTPQNPTGKVFSRKELEMIADLVRPHKQITVVSDEVYEWLVYDGSRKDFLSAYCFRFSFFVFCFLFFVFFLLLIFFNFFCLGGSFTFFRFAFWDAFNQKQTLLNPIIETIFPQKRKNSSAGKVEKTTTWKKKTEREGSNLRPPRLNPYTGVNGRSNRWTTCPLPGNSSPFLALPELSKLLFILLFFAHAFVLWMRFDSFSCWRRWARSIRDTSWYVWPDFNRELRWKDFQRDWLEDWMGDWFRAAHSSHRESAPVYFVLCCYALTRSRR